MCVFWWAFGVCSNIRGISWVYTNKHSVLQGIEWSTLNQCYLFQLQHQNTFKIYNLQNQVFSILNHFLVNELLSFLNPISSDIVCLIIISIEFMSNYFEIALLKKFPNPVLLKLHANTKGYMLPKHVYCIPANWNFTLLESKLQILF